MRLIDADALRKDVEKDRDASDMPKMWYQGVEYAINHIIHAPTVDTLKHGHWKAWYHGDCNFTYSCSICGIGDSKERTPYCPHCGVKMDEVEE